MLDGMGDSGMKEKILAKIMELLESMPDSDEQAKPEGEAIVIEGKEDPLKEKGIC